MVNGRRAKRGRRMFTVSIADFIYQRLSPIATKVVDRNYEPHVSRTSLQRASRSHRCSSHLSTIRPLTPWSTWHDSPGGRFSPVTVRNLINYSAPIIPRVPLYNRTTSQVHIRLRFEEFGRYNAKCRYTSSKRKSRKCGEGRGMREIQREYSLLIIFPLLIISSDKARWYSQPWRQISLNSLSATFDVSTYVCKWFWNM